MMTAQVQSGQKTISSRKCGHLLDNISDTSQSNSMNSQVIIVHIRG